jgi:hypothetical protein
VKLLFTGVFFSYLLSLIFFNGCSRHKLQRRGERDIFVSFMLAGISRDSRHKRRGTGGRRNVHVKKRKSELGRPAAETKIGEKRCVVRDNEVSFHW